jgi:hypothetical protein
LRQGEGSYFQGLVQPLRELGHDQADLLPHGHVREAALQEHLAPLDELRHALPLDLEVPILLLQAGLFRGPRARRAELLRQLGALALADGLPAEAQSGRELLALAGVVELVAQAEQRRLEAREAAAQVLGASEGEPQDEVRVMVGAALGLERRRARRVVGVQRQVLVEQRLHVLLRLLLGLVAERAGLELGEDCAGRSAGSLGRGRSALFSLLMAHSSNSSRVISAVGGTL